MYVCINVSCAQVTDHPVKKTREVFMAQRPTIQDILVCPKCGSLVYKKTERTSWEK